MSLAEKLATNVAGLVVTTGGPVTGAGVGVGVGAGVGDALATVTVPVIPKRAPCGVQ